MKRSHAFDALSLPLVACRTALLLCACVLLPAPALAGPMTGVTGGNQPFDNMQPSLAVTEWMGLRGGFPERFSGISPVTALGTVRMFAGNFGPFGQPSADGQIVPLAQNIALFSLLGTTYGGNGVTTFALPNLQGRVAIHAGSGPTSLGAQSGVQNQTLTVGQLPAHTHTLSSGVTGSTGGNLPFGNTQPSLGLNYVVALEGYSPLGGGGPATPGQPFVGQVSQFAGNFAPSGYAFAEGQLLPKAQYGDLFQVIGTTYGGDGVTTFALPDLRGRTIIGTGTGLGLTGRGLGETVGAEEVALTQSQMPAHTHTLPPSANLTGSTGGSQPFDNMQPSMALTYMLATQGLFPPHDPPCCGNTIPDDILLGEIGIFLGDSAPAGWVVAAGQLLLIQGNQLLFSLLGTTYGGDGITDFALPDLRGRSVIGAGGDWDLGQFYGQEGVSLTVAQLAAHDHTVPESTNAAPGPGTWALVVAGLGLMGFGARHRRD